ncbi:MAG: alpha-hydroxy-acid oxidizing protein, partial [Rhodospirillaceae bacterium]|nr:alpha-hydroxy-acid oxidizing protein [Rhodospirillaceae bacterium]
MSRKLDRCYNLEDLRKQARKRLPSPMYHYMRGGADDEWSLNNNTAAFDRYELLPRYLVNVEKIDAGVTVLGQELEWPLFLSPTGMSRIFHHDGEIGAARAAHRSGTMYS